MDITSIEKLDKSRYNLIKWFTVGWAVWFGGFIVKDLIDDEFTIVLILLFGLFGWVIFFLNLIRFRKFGKIVNSDKNLKNALNDEFIQQNRSKSFMVGYCSLLLAVCIFLVVSQFTTISAILVCKVTLYIGVLSTLISFLIYNKG